MATVVAAVAARNVRAEQHGRLQRICRELLNEVDPDPYRDELLDTPRRFADWWMDRLNGETGTIDTQFTAVGVDQVVAVSGMRVWSLCEHHLLPFWCDLAVAYIPGETILGLSKFARIAHKYARQLQVQERLVTQIADHIKSITKVEDVAVLARGEHLCMTMRGARTPALMTSSSLGGRFRSDAALRAEFMALALAPKP